MAVWRVFDRWLLLEHATQGDTGEELTQALMLLLEWGVAVGMTTEATHGIPPSPNGAVGG